MAEKSMRGQIEEAAASLGLEVVDKDELADTREMASQMPAWRNEAERLAGYLWAAEPEHPVWNDELWSAFRDRMRDPDRGIEPDKETEAIVARHVTADDVAAANEREERREEETMVDRDETLAFLEREGQGR